MSAEPRASLLVIDDDTAAVDFLVESLVGLGYRAKGVSNPGEGLELALSEDFDIVLTDVVMPGMRGTDLLEAILREKPGQLVLLMTAFGSIDLAVECVRAGACDFIAKPFRMEAMELAIERALRERKMRREIVRLRRALRQGTEGDIVAQSDAMRRVMDVARRAASSSFPVLLTGESGTGKSRIARFIHEESARASRPFVIINCAALPPSLIESELFGVRKGAYTDAFESRPGVFAQADGGTLFLDEVGELPLEVQPKLLHALEAGIVRPVGAREDFRVDVRVVAATNRDLEEALRQQRFRPDLYFRLNVIRIEIPPLRKRPQDIPPLIDALLARAAERSGRQVHGVSQAAMRLLLSHRWEGNVRELANAIERAVALCEHDTLVVDDFDLSTETAPPAESLLAAARAGVPLEEIERRYVKLAVDVAGGNISEAARVLKVDRRTIYKKLQAVRAEPRAD